MSQENKPREFLHGYIDGIFQFIEFKEGLFVVDDLELLDRSIEFSAYQAAQDRISEMESEIQFNESLQEPDDKFRAKIISAAKQSFRKSQSGYRGAAILPSDSFENHIIWAVQAESKAREQKLVEALKFYSHEGWNGPARQVLAELGIED